MYHLKDSLHSLGSQKDSREIRNVFKTLHHLLCWKSRVFL